MRHYLLSGDPAVTLLFAGIVLTSVLACKPAKTPATDDNKSKTDTEFSSTESEAVSTDTSWYNRFVDVSELKLRVGLARNGVEPMKVVGEVFNRGHYEIERALVRWNWTTKLKNGEIVKRRVHSSLDPFRLTPITTSTRENRLHLEKERTTLLVFQKLQVHIRSKT